MDFTGKKVLITGAARGLGRIIALEFAKRGAQVAIHCNSSRAAAEQVLLELEGKGHFIVQADLKYSDRIQAMVENVAEKFGKIEILINNAAVILYHHIATTSYEEWNALWSETLTVNLLSAANLCYCVAQKMKKTGGGRMVNVSSRGAFRGEPDMPAYGASKAGLNSMSQSLAQALVKWNIFVGVVAPGFIDTDRVTPILQGEKGEDIKNQSPLGRVAHPEEVAMGVMFLAADGTEFMTGAILDINGASYLRS
ncbi:MAG: SDR family oxidoreductase [Bacteroidota bacterium]